MKKCPYCAEEIQDEALVCRFCGREITLISPRQKTNKLLPVAILIIMLAICGVWALFLPRNTNYLDAPSKKTNYSVIYEVTGNLTNSASMTWENNQGGSEQGDYSLPFKKSLQVKAGDFVYISAQNANDYGSITCRILVDGVEWKKSESSGAYTIATCSGSVGE